MPTCTELATALTALGRNDMRLRDWAALGRYREQNRTLAAPASNEPRVVFMGDSITDAWPQPRFGTFFEGKPYVGRGISGQTTPQMLIRFRPDVVALKPKVVVILAGTNDIAGNTGPMTNEEIQDNLASMAEIAKANDIKVVFSSILPISAYHTAPNGVPQTQARPMERDQSGQRVDEEVRRRGKAHLSRLRSGDVRRERTAAHRAERRRSPPQRRRLRDHGTAWRRAPLRWRSSNAEC